MPEWVPVVVAILLTAVPGLFMLGKFVGKMEALHGLVQALVGRFDVFHNDNKEAHNEIRDEVKEIDRKVEGLCKEEVRE